MKISGRSCSRPGNVREKYLLKGGPGGSPTACEAGQGVTPCLWRREPRSASVCEAAKTRAWDLARKRGRPMLLLALVVGGCASAPPAKRQGHGLELPPLWYERQDGAGSGPVDELWWRRYDPTLGRLLSEALQHNHNLEAAASRVAAAAAQARIAGAPQRPQLSAAGTGSRRRQNFAGFPLPTGNREVLATTTNNFGVSLNVSWEADLWGRLRAGQSAALAEVMASRADLAGARLSLIAQTARACWAAAEATKQVALAEAAAADARLSTGQVEERYSRGLRSALDLRLAKSSEAAAEAVLGQRRHRLDLLKRQLEILLGRYPAAEIETGAELPEVGDPVPPGLPAELLARRPDLVAAERRLAAADARVREARRSLYPRISLTSSGGRSSGELNDLLKGDFGVWSLVGNLTQPLLQGGRLRAGVDLAEANREQAVARFAQQVLLACGEVESALGADAYLAQQESALQRAAEEAAAARRLARERYDRGLANLIALLDAQRRAYDAESQLASVRRQRLDNRTDLHIALGGDISAEAVARFQSEFN